MQCVGNYVVWTMQLILTLLFPWRLHDIGLFPFPEKGQMGFVMIA